MKTKIVDFAMMRGDTKRIGITIKGLTENPDEITFSIKKSKSDRVYAVQKTLTNGGIERDETQLENQRYVIAILPEDTQELNGGRYVYDLELGINGDVFTPLEGDILLNADVTRRPMEVSP